MGALRPSFIVGIGGSAGALDGYIALLEALPSNTGMTFVIISHMFPAANSKLGEILSEHAKMPLVVASNAMPIRANHVYVIPSNADLLIKNYTFRVVSPRTKSNVAIDLFFISLANAMGKRAIGIILSGYDGDGTEGCKYIKAKGGITFAQDKSAMVPHMSFTARASGCIDFVMPLDKVSRKLIRLAAELNP